jgi:nitrate reductase beta subunit
MYKRVEDGIVLVDQDRCRGWRMCVTACPYKKVYVNHATGKAEKCTFCFPRIEAGQPTVCSETCVGRLRYLGLLLYDADKVGEAAATPDEKDLLDAQRNVFLDPSDPEVIAAARAAGIPEDWLDAARRSPVYALVSKYKVALPLHPEYRTLPMVWYVPPLSPVLDAVTSAGGNQDDPDHVFAAVTRLRIPLEYLAELFTAGDADVVGGVLMKLTALRSYMRERTLGGDDAAEEEAALDAVGLTAGEAEDLHRLLAVAKYQDRYVVPAAHKEDAAALTAMENRCPVESSGEPASARKVMLGIPTLRRTSPEGHA